MLAHSLPGASPRCPACATEVQSPAVRGERPNDHACAALPVFVSAFLSDLLMLSDHSRCCAGVHAAADSAAAQQSGKAAADVRRTEQKSELRLHAALEKMYLASAFVHAALDFVCVGHTGVALHWRCR